MLRPILRWTLIGSCAVGVLAAGAGFALFRTGPGHETLLRAAVRQLSGRVNGTVEVGGIQAGNILGGFTLRGVTIRDPEGRPVLEADSVQVRYSFRDLLRRNIVLVPARVWGLRLTLESLEDGLPLNVERLFASSGTVAGAEAGIDTRGGDPRGLSVALRQVEIHDGEVILRLPAGEPEPESESVFERVAGRDGWYRVLRFTAIDARIAEADLVGGPGGPRIVVDALSFGARVLRTTFRISAFTGEIALEESAVTVDADPIRLQGSPFTGRVRVSWGAAGGDVGVIADLTSPGASLSDFRWMAPGLPDGRGPVSLSVSGPLSAGEWRVRSTGFRVGESQVAGSAVVRLGDPIRIPSAELEFSPLEFADVDAWLADSLGIPGRLRGRVDVRGDLNRLDLSGTVTYEDGSPEGALTGAVFAGGVLLGDAAALSDFSVTLDPFRYEALASLVPAIAFGGEGFVEATLSGSPTAGLEIAGRLEHWGPEWPGSALDVRGSVRETGGTWEVSLETTVDSLSMEGLAAGLARELPFSGMVRGTVTAQGPIGELDLTGRLVSSAGTFDGSARFDVTDPLRAYRVQGAIEDFRLHELIPDLPEPTVLTGDVLLDGEGADLGTLSGRAVLNLRDSQIAGLDLDLLRGGLTAVDGRLLVEAFDLSSPILTATGSGSLPLRDGVPGGEVSFSWSTPSIAGLRPILFGEEPEPVQALTAAERQILGLIGVADPAPESVGPALDGRASGEIRLTGSVTDMTVDGFVDAEEVAYRGAFVSSGRADVQGEWSREGGWGGSGAVSLEGVTLGGFAFERAGGDIEYRPGVGRYAIDIARSPTEVYRVVGALAHDSTGVDLDVESLALDLSGVEWVTVHPTHARISESRVAIDSLRLSRGTSGGLETQAAARGVLDFAGESGLQIQLTGVDLSRLSSLLQTDRLPEGVLSLVLDVAGPATAPGMAGTVRIDNLSVEGARLSRVEGILDYRDRLVTGSLVGTLQDRTLLNVSGQVPIDLSFTDVPDRLLDREMDVTLTADSLPAATALAFLEVLEEVRGTIDGRLHLGGTMRALRPTGQIALRGGSVFVPSLGIRPSGVEADLNLFGDSLAVLMTATSRGSARVGGTIEFEELSDPRFALTVSATGFEPVVRRDVVLLVNGDVTLTGSYTQPVVGGTLQVVEGDLYVEEFLRATQVVDLTDPSLLTVVDTALVSMRPVVAAQNPFLRNLRVDVDLALPSDFWLRSQAQGREMDVELAGNLAMNYDRGARELFLTGGLEAVRGTYTLYGKQFQVQDGTVSFAGTPGFDPALDIRATTRLRTQNAEPLNMTAQVQGTLAGPRVSLSSDAQPAIAESDLISYLLFGRPTFTLASGEQDQLLSSIRGGAVTGFTGLLTSGVGTELARQLGVDHLALTPLTAGNDLGDPSLSDLSQLPQNTQIEIGQYWHPLYVGLVLPPLNAKADANPGARVEIQLSDSWGIEGYVEDRFARQGGTGFGTFGTRLSRVLGLALFREWGY